MVSDCPGQAIMLKSHVGGRSWPIRVRGMSMGQILLTVVMGFVIAAFPANAQTTVPSAKVSFLLTAVTADNVGGCEVTGWLKNGTDNHIDTFEAKTEIFETTVHDLRALADYPISVRASTTCFVVVAHLQLHPIFLDIRRCDMPGISEGACYRMVDITSTI
jgi:hypothetical protein